MAAQIDEMLDVARLRMGGPLDLEREQTDLVALARAAAEEHRLLSERHQIRVESSETQLVGAWDAGRLKRVVDNLVGNAVKYSPNGGEVTLSLAREENANGAWATLAVRDQGMGIPTRDLRRVFERFRRAENVIGKIPGTGIGLADARQIVEQHGGRISVSSQEQAGTTFTIRLPLAQPANITWEQGRERID
jgi:signal transduction histidine kinase